MEEGVDAIDLLIGRDAIESRVIHLYHFRVGDGDGLFNVIVVRFIDFLDLVFIVIVGIRSFLRLRDAINSRAIHLYHFRVGDGDELFIVIVVRFIDFVDVVSIVIVGIGSFLRVGDAIDSRVILRRHYHLFRLGNASASLSE